VLRLFVSLSSSLASAVLERDVRLDEALGVLDVLLSFEWEFSWELMSLLEVSLEVSLSLCVACPAAAVALYGGGASRAIGGAWG
jgi:hypothetical protein